LNPNPTGLVLKKFSAKAKVQGSRLSFILITILRGGLPPADQVFFILFRLYLTMILAQLSRKHLSYRSFGSLCRHLTNLQWKFVVAAHKYKISRKCLKTTFVHDDRRKLTFYSTSFLSFKHSFLCSSLVEHSIVMSPPPFSIPYLDMLHQQLHSRLACRIPPRGFV